MISFENVCFSYNRIPVITDLSVTIGSGERACLSARSGTGKTTVIRLALGLIKPDKGQVTRSEGFTPSVVFQEDRLIPWKNAIQNVSMFSDEEKAREMLLRLGLEEAFEKLPSELSGGMKRRVALARALCHEYDHLILDEPFTGLDDATKQTCIEVINNELNGRTLLIATHDIEDAKKLGAAVIGDASFCTTEKP